MVSSCPWKCFDIRLLRPVWLFSAHTLGKAWRRQTLVSIFPLSFPKSLGIKTSCLSPRSVPQHGDRQATAEPASHLTLRSEESTSWWQRPRLLSARGCQRRTWSDHPHFCDSLSLKRPSADLKSLSMAASPGMCFWPKPYLHLCEPSSVSFIFTYTHGGYWSGASQGFQRLGFGCAVAGNSLPRGWRTSALVWHASTPLPLFI